MKTLHVFLEINGMQQSVGQIRYNDRSDACFMYDPQYAVSPDARAISLSLPVRVQPYSPQETKCFFEALLPEGFQRRSIAQWMHVREEDYLSILSGLGDESLGALRVANPNTVTAEPSYRRISKEEMADFAAEGSAKSAEILAGTHLSLAGASGKMGLYLDEESGQWYFPLGTAPSTHIVKQCHLRLDEIVLNEQLCQMTAKKLGMDVPESFLLLPGEDTREGLFATRRFDRMIVPSAEEISGKKRPLRLHQEDFGQALGIASVDKYEPEGENYIKQAFHLLLIHSADPIADQTRLWDLLIYDYLIGNTDDHIKNIALLYSADLDSVRLAPAYDRISTVVYDASTRDMALAVGGRYSLDEISRASFATEAKENGLGEKIAMQHFDSMAEQFEKALMETARLLQEERGAASTNLAKRILQRGGYHNL